MNNIFLKHQAGGASLDANKIVTATLTVDHILTGALDGSDLGPVIVEDNDLNVVFSN